MPDVVSLMSNVMQVDLDQLRSVSNNLANINTIGYKREVTTNTAFFPYLNGVPNTVGDNGLQAPMIISNTIREYGQGALKSTGNNSHIALEGDGFFVVKDGTKELYTRRGELMVNNAGLLALNSGQLLQGYSGDIFVGNGDFEINRKGEIFQEDKLLDKISVVLPANVQQLEYTGAGLVSASNNNVTAGTAENYTVLQGYLEAGNVDSTQEVIKMLEMLRHFELSSKVLQTYDGTLNHAITELGRF